MSSLYYYFILASLLMCSFTCSCSSIKERNKAATIEEKTIVYQKAIIGEAPEENPNTEILNATIDGDVLTLKVNYSGGCEEQLFDLVGSSIVMKSFPPQREVTLVRNARGDACRELITKELTFDVSELAYLRQKGELIILHLKGFGELSYYFGGQQEE